MALDDLLRAIEVEADEERLLVERERSAAATSIIEAATQEAAAVEVELAMAPEGAALAEAERERALARLQAADTVRGAREEAFASLLGRIRDELAALRGSDGYPAVFRTLVVESRAALPEGRVLRVDRRDADLAASTARDLQVDAILDTWGGVELAADDGRTVRNTLEERLVNADQLLRGRFAHWLDTEAGTESAGAP
jgi:V/A-type H+/Na+-transporting ATPase subunit E